MLVGQLPAADREGYAVAEGVIKQRRSCANLTPRFHGFVACLDPILRPLLTHKRRQSPYTFSTMWSSVSGFDVGPRYTGLPFDYAFERPLSACKTEHYNG
jgi:hypothetical protein